MRKIALIALLMIMIFSAAALGDGVRVGVRDLDLAKGLDKRVTHILLMMQDGDESVLVAVASLNTANGKAQMTRIDPALQVNIPEVGDMPLSHVYACGDKKSRGFLMLRTMNRLLELNIANYVAVDMEMLPELVDVIESVEITPTEEEDAVLGLDLDTWALNGEEALAFARLQLPEDEDRSRAYEVVMQLLRQAAAGDLMSMMGVGKKLLSSIDTNLGIMNAVTLAGSLQGGGEHEEVSLPLPDQITSSDPLQADAQKMRQVILRVSE